MKRPTMPRTFEEALSQGWSVCEEKCTGELQRKGNLILERIHEESGDCERIKVPFTAQLKVGRPFGYRINRHAYLTPEEATQFRNSVARHEVVPAMIAHTREGLEKEPEVE